jgi:GMP synthase (glutamine-hydrolysing)
MVIRTFLPNDLVPVAKSKNAISGIKHKSRSQYGLQFHPEVNLTVNGRRIFENFLFHVCYCLGSFTLPDRLEMEIFSLIKEVGNKKVVVLASGGVDSTVCAKLLFKALGKNNVYVIHIDNGFMRLGESDLVKKSLETSFNGHNVQILRCSDLFFNGTTIINDKATPKLCETNNPEEKRKIIGDTFMKIITEEIERLGLDNYMLVQGTLRPDLIESASKLASGKAETIKTHHNDTNLVRKKRDEGLIIEPLKDYHKDEVRELGKMLELSHEMVWRHPFPGPGLSIRILCQDGEYDDPKLEEINKKLESFKLANETRLKDVSLHLLPVKSVGVQGDGRSYSYVIGISSDSLNWDLFFDIAKEIPTVIHGINRVVYIFGPRIKHFVPMITPTKLVPEVVEQLRIADHYFNTSIKEYREKIAQAPVILVPLNFGIEGNRSIVVRPFVTKDFMTGVPAVPNKDLPEQIILDAWKNIVDNTKNISRVMYDLTSKPPGTTEWE